MDGSHGGSDAGSHGGSHGGGHAGESHDAVYVRTIILLTVLTAAEFGMVFGNKAAQFPMLVLIGGLMTMAVWKAVLVGKVFMHLKYDPRILKWIAITPVVLATPLYLIASYDFIHGMKF